MLLLLLFFSPHLLSAPITDSDKLFKKSYTSVSRVGYYFEYLGEVPRSPLPEIKTEGYLPLSRYPLFDNVPNDITNDEKTLLYEENCFLVTAASIPYEGYQVHGSFDILDQDGYLYYNNQKLTYENGTERKLYRHYGSIGFNYGDISDDEPAINKRITLKPRVRVYSTTGLYAPAGEVISVRISEKELAKIGNLNIGIGPILSTDRTIETKRDRYWGRMPLTQVIYKLNSTLQPHVRDGTDYIFYIGSFFGGPILAKSSTFSTEEYTFSISGAVPHSNFILGYTTPEEFEYNKKSTAPYFILDVYTKGISFSGPLKSAGDISYINLYEAAIYWEKATALSNQYSPSPASDESITMIHEPYIPAGAALANRGGSATHCPTSWLNTPLVYRYNLMDSGNWGTHHEYNHHFQNSWGFYGGTETTNNIINLATFSYYNRNSQRRTETSDDINNGWNDYNSATWVLKKALAETHENYYLSDYIVLLHCFGHEYVSLSARTAFTHGGDNDYYTAVWTNITELDFTYFFETLYYQRHPINKTKVYENTYGNKGYKNFIPIACVYQTGLGYIVKGKRNEVHTMRPFLIFANTNKVINFNEKMVIPNGFTFTIKSVTNPEFGTLTKQEDNIYVYSPDPNNLFSGKMTFLIGLTKNDDPNFLIDDIEMYIEFQQTYGREKFSDEDKLDLDLYVYPDDIIPEDPVFEYENGFSRSIEKIEMLNNKTSKCFSTSGNTEMVVSYDPYIPQRVSVLRGKFEIQKGKYRIALRARHHSALYLSFDNGQTYSLECKVLKECSNEFFIAFEDNPDFFIDKEFTEPQWVYFKIVMCHKMDVEKRRRFAEIGIGQLQEDGNVIIDSVHDAKGVDYQPDPDFYPEDRYPKLWAQAFALNKPFTGTILERNYRQWGYLYNLENMVDSNTDNGIKTWPNFINSTNPFSVVIDLGSEITANYVTIFGFSNEKFNAKDFLLYVGTDRNDLKLIANVTNAQDHDNNVCVNFELQTFRYYKLEVYKTHCTDGRDLLSFRYIQFTQQYQGRLVPIDNNTVTLYNGWEVIHYPSANFGKIYKSIVNTNLPSKASFRFNGTSFGINAYKSPDYGRFFVYVDGQKIGRIRLDEPETRVQCVYIVTNLENTEHEVVVEDISGTNIDSFMIINSSIPADESFYLDELPPIKEDLFYAEDTPSPSPSPELIQPELPSAGQSNNNVALTFDCPVISGSIKLYHTCSNSESVSCLVSDNVWVNVIFENGDIANFEYIQEDILQYNGNNYKAESFIKDFNYDKTAKKLQYVTGFESIHFTESQTENNLNCIMPPTQSPLPTQSPSQSPTQSASQSPIPTYSPEPIPDEIPFEKAEGNYVNDDFVNQRLISTTFFTCKTSGDLTNYPISNALNTNNNLHWIGHRPVSETFQPYIIFEFKKTYTLDAILFEPAYRTRSPKRYFDGLPFKLHVYSSINNGPYQLKYRFSGEVPTSDSWLRFKYAFPNRLECDKLKLVLVNVTENESFELNKARNPSSRKIFLLNYIPPEEIKTPTPSETLPFEITIPPTEDISTSPQPAATPNAAILNNTEGLINITCDKFEYTQWEYPIEGGVCVNKATADHGSYTRNSGAKAKVTFIGTKVHVLAWKQANSGPANIWIDNKIVATPNFNSGGDFREAGIVFTSNDLSYGEHTIEIEHNGTNDEQSIAFGGVYVDPLPKEGGFTLTYDDAVDSSEFWLVDTTSTPNIFYTDDVDAYITFRFFGTRFWITGVRGNDVGEFQLIIDENDPIVITERQSAEIAQDNKPVLLYQSSELQYKEHEIKIMATEYKISLVNVMFTTYPYHDFPSQSPAPITQEPTPEEPDINSPVSIPISIPISSMTVTGNQECSTVTTCPSLKGNDQECPSNAISSTCGESCKLTNTDDSFEYSFRGEKFQIYGSYGPTLGRYNIYVDNELIYEFNQRRDTEEKHAHQFTSDILTYGDHTIRAVGIGDAFEIYKFTFWPSIKAIRVDITEFTKTSGSVKCESDGFGGLKRYVEGSNSEMSYDISSDHVWLYGSRYGWGDRASITFGSITGSASSQGSEANFILHYETPSELTPTTGPFKIRGSGSGTFMSSFIYYIETIPATETPTQSASQSPTQSASQSPTQSASQSPTQSPSQSPTQSATPSPMPTESPVSIPISIPISSMTVTGNQECSTVTTCPSLKGNGQECPSNAISSTCGESCKLTNTDDSFEYSFRGEKFQIYGSYGPTLGRYNIYVDNELIYEFNQRRDTEEKHAHQFTSDILTYGDHTIRAVGIGDALGQAFSICIG